MYDSTTPGAIPADAEYVAVYDDGALYATPKEAISAFEAAGKTVAHITVTGETLTAKWGDCEWGDMDEYGLRDWLSRKAAANLGQGGGYGSASRLASIVAVCGRIPLWSAHYTYEPHLCGTACGLPEDIAALVVATQYADHGPDGENYDMSLFREGAVT